MIDWLRKIFLFVIGIVFLVFVVNFLDIKNFDLSEIKTNYFNWKIVVCILLYLMSHVLRSLRLFVISGDVNVSLKQVFFEQFKTNGVNLVLPFKLGEAYRIVRFKEVFKSGFISGITIIIERFFDFFILALMFSLGLYLYPHEVPEIQNTMITIMFVLVLILVTVLCLEDTIQIIHKRLLYRFKNPISFSLLKFTNQFLRSLAESKKVLKAKYLSILSFTILIWSFELLSLFMFFNDLDYRIDLLVLLMVFIAFSSLLPNGPLGFGGIQLSFYTIYVLFNSFDNYLIASTAYTIYIFGSAIVVSIVLFIINFIKKRNERK